jgi:hypothetical protein
MTQSKDDDITITIINELSKELQSAIDNSIVIDLNNTYGATTTYLSDTMDTITISDGAYTIASGSSDWVSNGTFDINSIFKNNNIDQDEVERMCKEYPGLEKVWNNFKAVYDMVKQDYEGKKQAGELDE